PAACRADCASAAAPSRPSMPAMPGPRSGRGLSVSRSLPDALAVARLALARHGTVDDDALATGVATRHMTAVAGYPGVSALERERGVAIMIEAGGGPERVRHDRSRTLPGPPGSRTGGREESCGSP